MRIVSKMLLATFGTFIGLTMSELFARVLISAPHFEIITVTTGDDSQYQLSPNPALIYIPKPSTGALNIQGARGAVFPLVKPVGKVRILFIGDSVVEGLGVSIQERFTDILQKMVPQDIEIINRAVRGYNLVQEKEFLKEFGVLYHPDIVINGITWNDLIPHSGELTEFDKKLEHGGGYFAAYYGAIRKKLPLVLGSRLVQILFFFFDDASRDTLLKNDYRYGEESPEQTLAEMNTLSEGVGATFFLLTLPVNTDKSQLNQIVAAAHVRQIPNINLEDEIGHDDKFRSTLFLKDDPCHLSKVGNQVAAEMIFNEPLLSKILAHRP